MADRVKGKRILVTGGSSGIGRAAVDLLKKEGGEVIFCSANAKKGEAAAREMGVGYIQCDVRSEKSIADFIGKGVAELGGLDSLVQVAGIQYGGKVDVFPTEHWDDTMLTNVRSVFLGAKYAIPHLKKTGSGTIINTASVAGKRGGAGMTAYAASKGAIIAFGTGLARELAPFNIRVNTICPGWVDTEFNKASIANLGGLDKQAEVIRNTVPLARQATPEEIAPLYVYMVSDESSFMTAQSVLIDGGQFN